MWKILKYKGEDDKRDISPRVTIRESSVLQGNWRGDARPVREGHTHSLMGMLVKGE